MASASFRVVIARFDEARKEELADELGAELDLSRSEAAELLRTLPLTVARGLDEDDAEDLADALEDHGAKVRIVEVTERRRRRPSRRRLEDHEDDLDRDEDDEGDEGDAELDEPRAAEPVKPKPGARRSSQRILIVAGGVVVAVVIAVVVMSAVGVDFSFLSCSGGFRGPGANPQLEQTLAVFAERYAKGFRPDDSVAHGTLGNKQVASLRENLTGPACYVWIGLSQQGSDLDLHLRRGGQVIAEDRGEDNYPVVRHCVSETGIYELDAEMFSGTSDWVVQRYAMGSQPGVDLLEQMHSLYSSMFIANAEPDGELRRVKQLSAGEDRVIPVQLDSQWCYAVLAVSRPGTDLDTWIENPRGLKISEDAAVDNYPLLRDICPTETGEHQLHMTMYTGSSEVVFRVFRGKLPGTGAAAPPAGSAQPQPLELNTDAGQPPSPAGDAATQPPRGSPEPAGSGAPGAPAPGAPPPPAPGAPQG